jgi:hypothetical protein
LEQVNRRDDHAAAFREAVDVLGAARQWEGSQSGIRQPHPVGYEPLCAGRVSRFPLIQARETANLQKIPQGRSAFVALHLGDGLPIALPDPEVFDPLSLLHLSIHVHHVETEFTKHLSDCLAQRIAVSRQKTPSPVSGKDGSLLKFVRQSCLLGVEPYDRFITL